MKSNSKALLDLEGKSTPSTSSLESKLLFCNGDENFPSRSAKLNHPDKKPTISPIPQSQFLGKVKDFLGVISEANKKLELDAKTNPENYDIEALNGEESEYIEMDLMLGFAELQNEEAVAAAESALAGSQPLIPLADSSSDTESEDDSDEDDSDEEDDDEDGDEAVTNSPKKGKNAMPAEKKSLSEASRKSRKRPRIVELS